MKSQIYIERKYSKTYMASFLFSSYKQRKYQCRKFLNPLEINVSFQAKRIFALATTEMNLRKKFMGCNTQLCYNKKINRAG